METKLQRLIRLIKDGRKPIIVFIQDDGGEEYEKGMLTRCVNVSLLDDGVYTILTNFSEFLTHNQKLETPDYYDNNAVPCLKWSETKMYPPKRIVKLYVSEEVCDDGMTTIDQTWDFYEGYVYV